MKKNVFLLLSLFTLAQLGFSQQIQAPLFLEINETHTPAFRDSDGNIHIYYTIHGLFPENRLHDFNNGIMNFGGVIDHEVLNQWGESVLFHTVLYSEAKVSFMVKMFYKQGVYKTFFFGEWYNTNELNGEIVSKHLTL